MYLLSQYITVLEEYFTVPFLITQEEDVSDEAAADQSDDDNDDDVFNDPDFAHMSDSDLDSKLPLFEGSDSEPDSDSEEAEKEAEKKADKKEEREREVQAKADDYMANALNSIRSNVTGKDGKKNPRAQVHTRFPLRLFLVFNHDFEMGILGFRRRKQTLLVASDFLFYQILPNQ